MLIAADVLKKSGKTVHTDESSGLVGKYCKSNMSQEKMKYHRKIVGTFRPELIKINPLNSWKWKTWCR